LNLHLGKVEVGNNGQPFAIRGEVDNDLERNRDSAKPVKVSVRLGSHDAVNARTIVIWNDFEGDSGEEIALFAVKVWV
jgi:hypothetical protein